MLTMLLQFFGRKIKGCFVEDQGWDSLPWELGTSTNIHRLSQLVRGPPKGRVYSDVTQLASGLAGKPSECCSQTLKYHPVPTKTGLTHHGFQGPAYPSLSACFSSSQSELSPNADSC